MRKTLLALVLTIYSFSLSAQNVGIGTTNPSAKLDITSDTSGILIPRVSLTSTTDATTVTNLTVSELVYNTATIADITPGFYYWNGSNWVRFIDVATTDDVDWFESPGTTAPDDITDDIYTNGNVGIGVNTALEQLHVAGNIRVDGDTIMTVDNTATQFTMLSNGGIVMKLDNDDNGTGEEFSIKRGGVDLNSKVFTVTEAGNTNADGWGVFGGRGEFNGDLTILGNSRHLYVQDNFDIEGTGSIDFLLDTDADNQSSFSIKNDAGDNLLEIAENHDLTLYGIGASNTGGVRLRELSANGSNWIAISAPDNISANRTFVWPNVYGSSGQVLTTDGTGTLSWTTINTGVATITAGDALTNSGTATDPVLDVTTDNLTISNTGTGGTLEVIGLPAGDDDYIQNQDAAEQSGARFRIQGDGTVSDFNITGGDIYGPGINYGSNSDARLHSRIDIEMILDDDANGSNSFMIYKNGTIDDRNRVFIFEEGGTFKLKESGNVASPFYAGLVAGNLSADVTFTLPLDAGNSGEFLQTDGTGVMSWNDGSALQDHDWYEVGGTHSDNISDDIYTSGAVGIGTTSPDVTLSAIGIIRAASDAAETEYIEMDHGGSHAYINWAGDGNLDFRKGGTTLNTIEADGDLNVYDHGILFTDTENSDAIIELRASDPTYPDEGVTLRTLTNPTAGEPIFRVLSSGGAERLRVEHDGAVAITNDLEVSGIAFAQSYLGVRYQTVEGPGTGADDQYHTVTCNSGYAITQWSVYANDYWDGNLWINCIDISDVVDGTRTWRNGPGTGSDDTWHTAECNSNEVATGIRAEATGSYIDGNLGLYCQAVNSNYTRQAQFKTAAVFGFGTGDDGTTHGSICPTGSVLTRISVWANAQLDGNENVYCAGITPF